MDRMKHAEYNKELRHMVLLSCAGQSCGMCKAQATHKVEQDADEAEVVAMYNGKEVYLPHHPFTQYVCCKCFRQIMGAAVQCGK